MSNGPTSTTRKETVYSGPEVDLFKPKQSEPAKSSGEAKKETVFEGDAPEFITRRFLKAELARAAQLQTETVHQGPIPEMFARLGRIAHDLVMPDRETIYQGPEITFRKVIDVTHAEGGASGNQPSESKKETVFDEATFIPKRVDTSAARGLVTRLVQRASVRFFAVALLSGIELYFCRNNLAIAISSGFLALTFSVVGFYTFKLNLKALLFAIGIYACTTVFMAASAMMTDRMLEMMIPLLSRGFMMYNLLRTYGLLVDLHLLEAEIY